MKAGVILAAVLLVLLSGCGGGNKTPVPSPPSPNPLPSVSSVSPTSAQAGSAAITLTVNGTGFIPTSLVFWNGASRTTTYVSATNLTASISAADLANAGAATVSVVSPTPGGGTSNAMTFTVNAVPAVQISFLGPAIREIGLPDFVLVVIGTGFVSGSVVRWNGQARATTFVSATELRTNVLASEALVAATISVTVANPDAGSGSVVSAPATLTFANPLPNLTTASPSTVTVGGSAFTLVVTGTGFIPTSVVRWNGSDRPTVFNNSSTLSASISAADIASASTTRIEVFNPVPGGGISGTFVIAVSPPNPVPTLTALTPASLLVGDTSTITVDGTGFVPTSTVRWNANSYRASFVSSTRLTFNPAGQDISVASANTVAVENPAPGGGVSNQIAFNVNNPVPVLSSVTPATAIAGDAPLVLSLGGTGFTDSSKVLLNGVARAILAPNSGTLSVQLTAADLASAGTIHVTVQNPGPGGGTSGTVDFAIAARTTNPQPTIASLGDSQAPAGWPGFSLVANGTGFVGATVLNFDGTDVPTTVLSSTQLRAAIPPSALSAARSLQVKVTNPTPGGGSSASATFTVNAVAAGAIGVADLVTKGDQYIPADISTDSFAASADGRFVAFVTSARNLLPALPFLNSVYLRDTCLNAPSGCVPSTIRISQNASGDQANSDAVSAAISASGRYVAFLSNASNLLSGATGAWSIYLRDTCIQAPSGCVPTLFRVQSLALDETPSSFTMSGDAQYIAYSSYLSNGNNGTHVVNTCAGAASACAPAESALVTDAGSAKLNGDGRYLAFISVRADLVANDTNNTNDIFLMDLCTGASGCTRSVQRVSTGLGDASANDVSFMANVSAGGRFVVFSSWATNLVANDANVGHQVYLRDTCAGVATGCVPTTLRVSVSDSGTQVRSGGPATDGLSVTDDGRYVAFGSNRPGLVTTPNTLGLGVYVRDTCVGVASGCSPTTRLLAVSLAGVPADSSSSAVWISPDGKVAAFKSVAANVAPGTGPTAENQVYLARTPRQ